MTKNPYRFYTYAYLREDKTPYYIGKGQRDRIYSKKGRPCNKPKNKSRIIFLKQNLTEEEAFKHEIYMIAVFGRKDLGTGILHNKTNGGDGTSGEFVGESTRIKLSNIHKGKKYWTDGKVTIKETECPGEGWVEGYVSNHRNSGYKWWNNGTKEVMEKECPGEGWIVGRIKVPDEEFRWWNNGIRNTFTKEYPGKDWTRGRIKTHTKENGNKGNICWNNGIENIRSKECPGNGWSKGMLKGHTLGYRWWNNGEKSTRSRECPGTGWKIGRILMK